MFCKKEKKEIERLKHTIDKLVERNRELEKKLKALKDDLTLMQMFYEYIIKVKELAQKQKTKT